MKESIKEIFRFCALFLVPPIGLGALLLPPHGSEPTLKLTPGQTVTLTALSGDKMTCDLPASDGRITCVRPDGEKAICKEIDVKGIFSNCAEPWKWRWQDRLNGFELFAHDPTAITAYQENHPFIPRSAF